MTRRALDSGDLPHTKLSWEETARAMAASNEDWSDWDATLADGLDETVRHWQETPARGARRKVRP